MYIWPFGRPGEEVVKLSSADNMCKNSHFSGEKFDLPQPATSKTPPSTPFYGGPRRSRKTIALLLIGLIMLWTFSSSLFVPMRTQFPPSSSEKQHSPAMATTSENKAAAAQEKPHQTEKSLVPLEAHIMSKCPDAHDCMIDLILPTMARTASMVNWTLSFIGEMDSNGEGVSCMHGEGECLGNVMMLCAAKLYPDPKISLGFSTCLIRDYEEIPSRELIESCALEHAVDFDKLNNCASEEHEGLELLKNSVQRSKDKGVKYSCTVRLNDKVRCIRDGGEWVDCEDGSEPADLIRDIKTLYANA